MPDPIDGMLGTIGLEIETELLLEEHNIMGWRNTHDASIEIPVVCLRNRRYIIVRTPQNVIVTDLLQLGEHKVLGREFVSGIFMEEEEIEPAIRDLFRVLQIRGERTQNKRAGFHVHIGWAYDLKTLKRTVLMNAWLESLLFHLGGMGYEFRGMDNNSAYCRPITMYGPPVVDSNMGKVQMTNVEALLLAPTVRSFWNRFGGININNLPKRYTPQRYMGVNLFSVFLHKTLEFRMFNTTLNKEYIMAIIKLCKELTKFTQSTERFPDEENSVYVVKERRVNHNLLSQLCSYIEIDSRTEEALREILERSPVPTLPSVHVFTHINDKYIGFDEYDFSKVSSLYPRVDEFVSSGIMDIHILENELINAQRRLQRAGRNIHLPDRRRVEEQERPDFELRLRRNNNDEHDHIMEEILDEEPNDEPDEEPDDEPDVDPDP